MIFIFVTFSKKAEAVKIGKALLKKRLIACYNLSPVESAYWWQNKIVDDKEILTIFKARADNFQSIEKYIVKNHSYKVPEIVAFKASEVTFKYLAWLEKETK